MVARAMIVLSAVFLFGGVSEADDAKKEMEKFKGTWSVVSAERQGEPNEQAKNDKLIFDGDKVTVKTANRDQNATYKLDPSKKPKEIDIVPTEGSRKDQPHPGIYELEGDTLKICFTRPGNERPKELRTGKDKPEMYFVLKRDK